MTGWMRTHVGGLLGHARHDLVAWWRDGTGLARDVEDGVERFGNDALEAFDREWADARQILVDTSSALGDATLLVCGGVLVFVGALAATGFGAPAAAVIAGADLAVIEAADDVIEAESIAILAGDSLEIKRGHREYLNELPSDGLGVVPGSKVFAPLERRAGRAIRSSPGLRKATQSLVRTAKRVLSPTVAKREGKGILKLGEDAAKDQVDNGMEFVEHNFKPLISAPLERPLTFKLVLPLLSPAAR